MSDNNSNTGAAAAGRLAVLAGLYVAGRLMSSSKDSSSNINSSTAKDSKNSNIIHELRGY